jgi:hypothetical protein
MRSSAPGELARVWPARLRADDRERGNDRAEDEREHSSRVDYRHEVAAAVFELDVAGRRDDAAASAALALLALARIRSAAAPKPNRATATGTTVTPSRSTAAPNTVAAPRRAPIRSASADSNSSPRRPGTEVVGVSDMLSSFRRVLSRVTLSQD